MTIADYTKDQLLNFYQRMLLIREFELRAINERRAGLIMVVSRCAHQTAYQAAFDSE